ncbi:MAG: prolipoprotein diacylglyceryl transferase [Prevotellaceae bacterium]|jgi:prolipoprotein diacylglyceryl transferase|nr:prolipoprotein diacylglyceryl transferase [Prevotellaceae bacterium]
MIYELLYVKWDVSPEIFDFGFFQLRWYSLMFVLSFFLGANIFRKMLKREQKPAALWENILFPVFIGTFLGARLGHCLFYHPDYFIPHFWEIFIPLKDGKFVGFEGVASHGAAVGILIGLYYYSRKNKVAYLWTLDRIVITIALAGFFIRIGNLMNSEIYGHETTLPWGFIFLRHNETVPKHPTQIYESICYLAIFIFLYLLYLKKRPPFRDGVIFSIFLILLFGARFCIEFLKEVQADFEEKMFLDMGQWLSIPLIVAGFVLLIFLYKQGLTVELPKPEPVNSKPATITAKPKQPATESRRRTKRRGSK